MVGNVATSHYRGELSHYRATFSGISGRRPPERDESLSPLSDSLTSAEVPEEVPARKERISNKTPCSAGGTVADIAFMFAFKLDLVIEVRSGNVFHYIQSILRTFIICRPFSPTRLAFEVLPVLIPK